MAQIKLCPAWWLGLPKRGGKAGVKGFPEVICAGTNLTSSTVPSNMVCVRFFPLEVSGGWRAGQVADELRSASTPGPRPLLCSHPPPLKGLRLQSCLLCPRAKSLVEQDTVLAGVTQSLVEMEQPTSQMWWEGGRRPWGVGASQRTGPEVVVRD